MNRLRQLRHALARSTALVAVTLAAPSALLGLSLVTATAILAKGGEGGEILGRFGAAGGAGPGQPGTNGPAPRNGGGGGGGGANGGNGGAGAAGGVGGTAPGQDGGNGGTVTGGNGGGGGGGGGGATGNSGNSLPGGSISGGRGGNGGAGGGAGGGGGEGGAGALLTSAGSATIQAGQTVRGGAGGNGGDAGSIVVGPTVTGDAGFAGGGGVGLSVTATAIDNRGVITGGDGGTGGNAAATAASLLQSWGSFGGDGGAGVSASGGTLTNSGTITGGNGGLGGLGANGFNLSSRRNAGAGGYGVTGSNLVVINSGTITGGFPGDQVGNEAFRTYAVVFTGGTNVLTLQTGSVLNGPASAAGTSTLNLQGTGTEDSFFLGFQTIDVAGGATWTLSGPVISATGTTVAVGNAGSLVLSGPLSGGPLIKNGAGTLTLAGANTYTGSTTITGGTVLVDGAIGTGAVDVQSGSTLGGMGTIGGGVTVADGGALRGVQGQTLSMAALALNGASNVNVTLGAPGGSRLFNVTGNLTLDGTLNVTKAGGFGPGAYRLFDYGGTLTDNGLAIGTVPGGVNASDFAVQTSAANQVNVVLAAAGNFWDGDTPANANNSVVDGGNGIWTATSNTWTGIDGATNGPLQPQPGFAIFQAAPGTVTVDNSAGAVSVSGMQFAVGGYFVQSGAITLAAPQSIIRVGDGTLAGANMTAIIAAPLVGSGGLEKTDFGTLVLAGANTYSGGTTITGGILQIGNGSNTGSITGAITNNSALTVNRSDTLILNGVISGTGIFTQAGTGTTILTADNIYGPGGTTQGSFVTAIDAGVLQLGNGGTTGSIIGSVVNRSVLAFNRSDTYTFDGIITGTGRLEQRGPGTTILTASSNYTGATSILGGTLVVRGAINHPAADLLVGGATPTALRIENGGTVASGSSQVGNGSAPGTVTVTGAGSSWTTTTLFVGATSSGTLTIDTGGRVNSAATSIGAGLAGPNSATVSGAGSTWSVSGNFFVGQFSTATLSIVDGATLTSGGPTAQSLLGFAATGNGTVVVSGTGSTWTDNGNGQLTVGNQGSGTLTIADSGLVSAAAGITLATSVNATGTLNIGAPSGSAPVAPGTLNTAGIGIGPGTGTVTFNHTGTNYSFAPFIGGKSGTINQIAGVTRLTADSTGFEGSTTISGGTLLVDGKLGTGPVSVQSGGTLGGVGTLGGAVTVADGGTLLGTQGQTLTMGALSLANTSNINVTLGAPGTTGLFNVTGNLTLDGRLNITDAGGFGPGVYRLIDYGGTLTDNGLAVGTTPAGVDAADLLVQTSVANQVNLVNGARVSLNFWDGDAPANPNNNSVDGGDGTWTATSGNWTVPSGASNGPMQPQPGFAIFQGAPGTVTVDNSAGTVAVTGMQFAVNGYRVQGGAITLADPQSIIRVGDGSAAGAEMAATIAAPLTGSGGLVKSDLGTLVLTAANTYTGATTISAGTLRIGDGGSIASSSALTLSAPGATLDIAADAGNSFAQNLGGVAGTRVVLGSNLTITSTIDTIFAGVLSGDHGLGKVGAATLTLTGANTYTGSTNVSGGTLALGAGGSIAQSSLVFIAQGATLDITAAGNQTLQALSGSPGAIVALGVNTLTVGSANNALFSGAITGSGGLVKTGTGTQALAGTNTYTGATTIAGGTLFLLGSDAIASSSSVTLSASGATLDIALGSNQTVQNFGGVAGSIVTLGANTLTVTSSMDTLFAGAIGGTGGLIKSGTGALELTGTSSYSGATTLTAGRLTVNGSIAGSIVSVTAGTLAGIGTVGGIVATGGTVAPGNSIGTLNVAGNISFAPGATYEVEIEPAGTSDLLHATGTATLTGGTVSVIKATGAYTAGTRYTIVTADAGVTGTFSGLTQNLPFINLLLTYDPNNVFLDITRNTVAFCDVAATRNQCAAGRGAESLGAGNTLYDAIASLPDTTSARQAFNALSGEVHASTRSALIEDSRYLRDAVVARTRRSGAETTAAPQFAALAQATDQSQRPQDGTAITAWFQGFGALARTAGDGNAASLKRTTGGFFIGADTKLADTWTVGLATGYSRTTLDINGRSSRADIDSYHLALYGGAQFGSLGVRLGASHTWHSIDSSRSITFPGVADAARADYKARTTQLFGDVGYALSLGDVAVEPFANLAWVHLSTNRFGERGGIAALRARGGTDSNLFSTLGIRAAAQVWNDDNKTLTLRGTLGWRHAFGDVTPAARLAFAGGASFGVEGVPIARNAVVVEAGFDLKVGKALTIGAGYSGVLASGAHDHAFKGNLTYRF